MCYFMLANKLRCVLPKCISKDQSAFVEDWSILDNFIVSIETIRHMKCKVRGKDGEFSLKIDLRKA